MHLKYTDMEAEKLRSQLPKVKVSIYRNGEFQDEILNWEKCSFIRDGVLHLSAEHEYSSQVIADYYGEFRGGYPWISDTLTEWADKRGLFWEWQNPGCIGLYE